MNLPAILLVLAAAPAAPASPATSAAPPPPAATPTLQQQFDSASQATLAGDCERAVAIFSVIEKDRRLKPGSIPLAAIAVRKGNCLVRLSRYEEGELAILSGLPKLEKAGEAYSGDVYYARLALGAAANSRLDYAGASQHYAAALKVTKGQDRLLPLMGLIKATSYDGDSRPLDYADEALRIIDASDQPNNELRGGFLTMRARAMLNQGQDKAAYTVLKQALKLMGGLTEKKVTVSEASMRADLAQAALLTGNQTEAYEYLAYTGAGRIEESPFAVALKMDVPTCGAESGLRPDDLAVVEFSIAPDGSVRNAQTVYTRGDRNAAAAFAGAVREWSWNPASLAKVPAFYLAATRVELRCTNAGAGAPGVMSPINERFSTWASQQAPQFAAMAQPQRRAELQRLVADESSTPDPAILGATAGLTTIGGLIVDPFTTAQIDRALVTDSGGKLPREISNTLRIYRTLWGTNPINKDREAKLERDSFFRKLLIMADEPEIRSDPIASATLRLIAARQFQSSKEEAIVTQHLALVANDSRLDLHHPLRQVANLNLSNLAATAKNLDLARDYFQRTGLTEDQCALIGVSPALRKSNVSSADYPFEALRNGFEGWVNVEFDIAADGKTVRQRPVIAYPPFVFSSGAIAMSRDFLYQNSYRPGGGTACSAKRELVRFQIP